MSYKNNDTITCKIYDFIGKTPACKVNTVINNLKAPNVSENSIRVILTRLKKANLVMCHKHNKDRNLFLTTLKKPLSEVKEIINHYITFKKKEKLYEHC